MNFYKKGLVSQKVDTLWVDVNRNLERMRMLLYFMYLLTVQICKNIYHALYAGEDIMWRHFLDNMLNSYIYEEMRVSPPTPHVTYVAWRIHTKPKNITSPQSVSNDKIKLIYSYKNAFLKRNWINSCYTNNILLPECRWACQESL